MILQKLLGFASLMHVSFFLLLSKLKTVFADYCFCGNCDTLPFKSLSLVKKEMNVFIQQRHVHLIKSDSKDVKNVSNSAVK